MTDEEHEAQIRAEAKGENPLFLLRLLDEARASLADVIRCNAALAAERDKARAEADHLVKNLVKLQGDYNGATALPGVK